MDIAAIHAKNIALFAGIDETQLKSMLLCLGAKTAYYRKGGYLLMAGEALCHVGILLKGRAAVYKTDLMGNRTVLAALTPPHLFAETFICAGMEQSPVTVEALADTQTLLISFRRLLTVCPTGCAHHNALIRNMLRIVAQKNITLTQKLDHIARRTTRQKLASYLIDQATRQSNRYFDIDLDRQALADYLCVNRSALSRELSAMREAGAIDYQRNSFVLKNPELLRQMLEQ